MSLQLPERASYEFLKKLAKERLATLRAAGPGAVLADAQLAIAREYGFPSWRALKAEIDRRREPHVAAFVRACREGDVAALRDLLRAHPSLARERVVSGSTGLHLAVAHPAALRALLEHGADPNARDIGDNALPLHFAAASGVLESVRLLLDAGSDVHGTGDVHHGDVIGWAARRGNEEVIDLLVERGARHHIFSAMALRDRELVRTIVEQDPASLLRRRSRFEGGHTPLHAAFAPPGGLGHLAGAPDYPMLELLIELGADLEATDDRGRTPLAVALLRGDHDAIRILRAAGAQEPQGPARDADAFRRDMMAAAESVRGSSPMFTAPDMRATVRWYRSIGFGVHDPYEDGGELVFARLTFGRAEFTLTPGPGGGPQGVSLWLFTSDVDRLYGLLKEQQLRDARGSTAGSGGGANVRFEEDLYTPFYGGRQFSIRDSNGLTLVFWQPEYLTPERGAKEEEPGMHP